MLTPIVHSSFSHVEVTNRSSNGTDLTSSIPFLQSHISPSTLEQRSTTSNTIRDLCPLPDTFASSSWCERKYFSKLVLLYFALKGRSKVSFGNKRRMCSFDIYHLV